MEEFAKLCCHIVEDYYGSFLAQIFRQLAQLGRLSIQQLAQKCRLPLRQVKVGVGTLIQLRLVYHHTTYEGLSTYQADTTYAYNIMRTGRLVELVEWSLGASAAGIMETLAAMGFATAHELEAEVLEKSDPTHPMGKSRFQTLLKQLVSSGYIKAVREAHFQSPSDRRQDVERSLRDNGLIPTGTGKKIAADAESRIDSELERRVNSSVSAYDVSQELTRSPTQDNTTLSVDYSNLIIRIRNDRVAGMAEKVFGKQIAQVARAACSQITDVDPRSLPVRLVENPANAVQRLDAAKLCSGVFHGKANGGGRPNGTNGHHSDQPNGATGEDRIIEHHLAVLAEGNFTFLLQEPNNSKSWSINKRKFTNFLRDKEIYRLIGESMTEPALRVVRMLADKGKLDERTMLDIGLLNAKELRKCLSALQTMGFLELQEVPKDPQRQPKNTIFLYFHDAERVQKVFLDKLYKTMSRMYERLHLERDKVASTLSKVERLEDGTEVEILPAAELQELYRWRQKESWFTTEIHRIDESIAILRDI
ncbi:DNA-directed RNA polymerase III subunit C3 [Cladophialophora carrionii]|uniref:DNA-directed RNA polymerase III subunit RPC3 n=1 Tax=Cladophialophora carrionii TaxID=86049 RepID=A0A1C1CAK3_9EURO|nr:DNA-directed RNA polymerase III subunit C3 [Cladophialophora carrionii]